MEKTNSFYLLEDYRSLAVGQAALICSDRTDNYCRKRICCIIVIMVNNFRLGS